MQGWQVDDYRLEWVPLLKSFYKVRVRRAEREVPWCLEDNSGLRLPILEGRSADPLDLVHLGAAALHALPPFPPAFSSPPLAPARVLTRARTHACIKTHARTLERAF